RTAALRLLGNLIVGATLKAARGDGAYNEQIQEWMHEHVVFALDPMFSEVEREKHYNKLIPIAFDALGRQSRTPFHWPLEFPEVFGGREVGFHALVGNPPF